jgi:hypothetical protein
MKRKRDEVKKKRKKDEEKEEEKKNKEGELICVDTQDELAKKLAVNRERRKQHRLEKQMRADAQARNLEASKTILDEIAKREKTIHPSHDEIPLITPGSGVAKLSFGRKKTHSYSPTEDSDDLMQQLERLPHVANMEEKEVEKLDRVYRESLGMETIAEHFTRKEAFVEKRPEKHVQVSVTSSKRAPPITATVTIQGETARLSEPLILPTRNEAAAEAVRAIAAATERPSLADMFQISQPEGEPETEERTAKRARLDTALMPPPPPGPLAGRKKKQPTTTSETPPSPPPTAPPLVKGKKTPVVKLTKSQQALVEAHGMRSVTNNEARLLFQAGERKQVKPKPVRGDYLARTETPPSGNANVRSLRREYMVSDEFNREAERAVDQIRASLPSPVEGALDVGEEKRDETVPTALRAALETRHVAVVADSFFELDEYQQDLLRTGDRTALAMAAKQRLPSRLPALPVEGEALRQAEKGRVPISVALENARLAALLEHAAPLLPDERLFPSPPPPPAEQLALPEPEDDEEEPVSRSPVALDATALIEPADETEAMQLDSVPVPVSSASSLASASASTLPVPEGLPLVSVKPGDVRQPLYRYFERFGKSKQLASDDLIEELIYDLKTTIYNPIVKQRVYMSKEEERQQEEERLKRQREKKTRGKGSAPQPSTTTDTVATPTPSAPAVIKASDVYAAVNPLGVKIMNKKACQRARNIKRQREETGRQAESEPRRLRSRIAEARVMFLMERWNLRDRMFAHDHPRLFEAAATLFPSAASSSSSSSAMSEAAKAIAEAQLKATEYGPIAQVLARHKQAIADRGIRTGHEFFISAEELGSARLHPSMNPSLVRVRYAYLEMYMQQPVGRERECINGRECTCYKGNIVWADMVTNFSPTNTAGFICKEWLSPLERRGFELNGKLPEKRRQCVVCHMEEITRLIGNNLRLRQEPTEAINRWFCVYVDEEGEFASTQCWRWAYKLAGRQLWTGIQETFPKYNDNDYHLTSVEIRPDVFIRCLKLRPTRLFR